MAELKVSISVAYRDGPIQENLQLDQIMLEFDLYDIRPDDALVSPAEYLIVANRSERRRRLVDALSSNMAHAITEGLFKLGRR